MSILSSICAHPFSKREPASYNVIGTSVQLNPFEIIEGIYRRIFYGTGDSNIPKSQAFQYMRIRKIFRTLLKECNVKKDVKFSIHYSSHAPACAGPTRIWFNPLFLLDWNALPDRLKVSGIDDPKLQNRDFYKDFYKHLSQVFSSSSFPQELSPSDIFCLLFFVQSRKNPKKSFSAIRTMLAHELGHIHYKHSQEGEKRSRTVHAFFHKWGFLSKIISPFTVRTIFNLFFIRSHEVQADRFAAKHLKDAGIGAEYGFTCAKKAIPALKRCNALTWKEWILTHLIMPFNIGHILLLLTHGSLSGRIHYMKKINQEAFS